MSGKRDMLSEGQRDAIETGGRNLLVSAAAGSGKTHTLVERIVRNIVAGVYGIDELLVVTFTNAAAAELRERIEKKLTEAIETHPGLSRQLVLLANASISTLHSFCQRLVRDNFTALGISPKFRLVSGAERDLMRYRVIEKLFEERYEARDEEFLSFVGKYGSDRDDERLYDMVLELADYAESRPDPAAWLARVAKHFDFPEGTKIEETIWYGDIRLHIGRTLAACKEAAAWLSAQAMRAGLDFYADVFDEDKENIEALSRAFASGSRETLHAAFAPPLRFSQLRAPRGEKLDDALKKHYSGTRDKEIKKPLKALREAYFIDGERAQLSDLRAAAPEAAALCRLATDFAEAFRTEKRNKETLDFGDLEHFALVLLQNEETARSLQARYKEIMVDEYQDTNGVQEAILRRVTNGRNLFMVGDVKQSIYRFRLADPTLFMARRAEGLDAGNEATACIELRENYRSRAEVLAAVNFLFAQLMVRPEMELGYDERAALYARADYPKADGPSFAGAPVEVLLVEEQGDEEDAEEETLAGFEAEAAVVAKRLRALMDSGVMVYDKDERAYHPIRWRDMAILLRSARGRAEILVEALRAQDVPAYAEADEGYFAETEVRLMLALLAVIDNARQDIPLAAVLRSVIGGMTAAELAELRADAPEDAADLYDALAAKAESEPAGKAARFLDGLARWRGVSRRVGVPELLWRLYRETGYYDYAGAQPGGLVRQANLRMLADRAADYEKTNFRGLFRFLQFIRRMRDRDNDLSVARTLGENEDVVRVMTVHKSKGLEFPVVVLAGIAKGFNLQDAQQSLPVHKDLGLGLYRTETKGTLTWRYPTLARRAVAERIRMESKAEEMRIFYVALTRAREKLILTASVSGLAKRALAWGRYAGRADTALPGHAVLGAKSWLDWLGMALIRGEAGALLREAADISDAPRMDFDVVSFGVPNIELRVLPVPSAENREESGEDAEWTEAIRRLEPLPVSGNPAHVAALSWRYGHRTDIPAKMTVTELKRRIEEPQDAPPPAPLLPPPDDVSDAEALERDFPPPEFLASAARGGVAFGTLMHGVMQNLRLDGGLDEAGIGAQLDRLLASGLMSAEERRAVKIPLVAGFFASPLGLRMRRARRVWREQPFSLLVPAFEMFAGAPAGDEIFLQGVIDVFFEDENGRLVLLDYKTDRGTTPDGIRARYRAQLDAYARAIRSIIGRQVDEMYIYRLSDGDAVRL